MAYRDGRSVMLHKSGVLNDSALGELRLPVKASTVIRLELDGAGPTVYAKNGRAYAVGGEQMDYFCGGKRQSDLVRVGLSDLRRFVPGGAREGTASYALDKKGRLYECGGGRQTRRGDGRYEDFLPGAALTEALELGEERWPLGGGETQLLASGCFAAAVPRTWHYAHVGRTLGLALGIPIAVACLVLVGVWLWKCRPWERCRKGGVAKAEAAQDKAEPDASRVRSMFLL